MRYALSPIIGTGTPQDPYRAKVSLYGDHTAVIPGNPDGTPASTWAVSTVGDNALTGVDGDGEIAMYPDIAINEVITADLVPIGKGTVDMPNLNEWVSLTVGEAITANGQQLDPNFTLDWLGPQP